MVIQWFGIACTLGLLGAVVGLIRRGALKERYALLWLAAGSVMLLFSVWRNLLHWTAAQFSVAYPPSLLFFVAFLFLLLIVLHLTIVISRMSERIRVLVQRVAILEMEWNARTRPEPSTKDASDPA